MADLTDLIERVEKATAGDRELDADLYWVLDHGNAERVFNNGAAGLPRAYPATLPMPAGLGRHGVRAMAPSLTSSVDAALALVERLLPGVWYIVGKGKARASEPLFGAQLLFGEHEVMGEGEHRVNLALALILATIRALQQNPQPDSGRRDALDDADDDDLNDWMERGRD